MKPWTFGPSDPLPLRALLANGSERDADRPGSTPRRNADMKQGHRRSIATAKESQLNEKARPWRDGSSGLRPQLDALRAIDFR